MQSVAVCFKKPDIGLRGFEIGKRYRVERIRTHKNIYFKVYEDKNNNLEFDIIELDSFKEYFQATDRQI